MNTRSPYGAPIGQSLMPNPSPELVTRLREVLYSHNWEERDIESLCSCGFDDDSGSAEGYTDHLALMLAEVVQEERAKVCQHLRQTIGPTGRFIVCDDCSHIRELGAQERGKGGK